MSTATCSDHGATVAFNSISNTQETSVDYVCTHEGGEMVSCVWSACMKCKEVPILMIVYLIGKCTIIGILQSQQLPDQSGLLYGA